tara:strand:+ start:685 stop:1371 length:687 start_codon:yes stop_codon:yes gene_type:complete
MKIDILQEIIEKKISKKRFAVLKNLINGKSELFEIGNQLSDDFKVHKKDIENYFSHKKNGIIEETNIFIQNYTKPIEVIIVGAVHIAQYLIDFSKNLNLMITIIDPREYFTKKQKFQNVKIINEWPEKILKQIHTDNNFALITLTHDPKIDDSALQFALKNKFFYIGALGSKKTHEKRCQRLKDYGYTAKQINSIHGPIGLKLGGKSPPEIALSIISQLVLESNRLNL